MLRRHLFIAVILANLLGSVAYAADAPIVDSPIPQSDTANIAASNDANVTAGMTTEQRINILEKQMHNLTQMDLVGQVNTMQQQLAQLRGQLDVQNHQVQQLNDQLKAQYQDIDQRISQASAKTATNTTVAKPAVVATTGAEVATPGPASAAASHDPAAEQRAYQTANQLLRNRDYVRATKSLQDFLAKYPKSEYAANAHYWLGEIYLQQGQPDQAVTEFNTVINEYSLSPKVPDAMLKLGFAYADKGDTQRARVQLQKVKLQFPGSTTAQLANAKLKELQHGK